MNKIKTNNLHFQVVFRPEPEGGFTVFAPALAGCVTYGKTLNQARKMIKEAISLYIEDLIAEGDPVPESNNAYISDIEITLPVNSNSLAYT